MPERFVATYTKRKLITKEVDFVGEVIFYADDAEQAKKAAIRLQQEDNLVWLDWHESFQHENKSTLTQNPTLKSVMPTMLSNLPTITTDEVIERQQKELAKFRE